MEDAAKGLDTALQKLDPKEIDKAAAKYKTTSESYQKLLLSSFSKEDSGHDYKAALSELARGMDRILAAFQEAVETRSRGKAQEMLSETIKSYTAMQKEFAAGLQATQDADSAYEECERILRTVCVTAETDMTGAKKLAAGLSVPCKNLATLSGRIDRTLGSLAETYQSMVGLKKSQPDLVKLIARDFQGVCDKAFALHLQLQAKGDEVKELVAQSKDAVKTAADALKGAVDLEKVMATGLQKFLTRIQTAAFSVNAGVLEKEGTFDKINFDFMNAKEGKVPAEQLPTTYSTIFKQTETLATNVAAEATRVTKIRETLVREFAGFDQKVVTESPQLKTVAGKIKKELDDFSDDLKRLSEVTAKITKLQGKVRAEL
jgi:hypothetical protein